MRDWVDNSAYGRALGVRLLEATDTSARLPSPSQEANANPGGALHGGCAASLGLIGGNVVARAALGEAKAPFHTAAYQVSYLAAAIGEDVAATTRLSRKGKTLCFTETTVTTPDGKPIAQISTVVRGREGTPAPTLPPARGDDGAADPVGAGNSSGHPEQAFRAASSNPSRCRPSALSSPGAPTNEPDRYGKETRNSSIRGSIRPVARGAERVSDRTIRVDRAPPVIHHTMRAAQAKPQVSDPDEFSAPTCDLTGRQRDQLDWIAQTDPRLWRAYLRKEGLRYVFAVKGNDGKIALDRWTSWARRSGSPRSFSCNAGSARTETRSTSHSIPAYLKDSSNQRTPRSDSLPASRSGSTATSHSSRSRCSRSAHIHPNYPAAIDPRKWQESPITATLTREFDRRFLTRPVGAPDHIQRRAQLTSAISLALTLTRRGSQA
jgi:uncharacterized protein (TIGR00369 family)